MPSSYGVPIRALMGALATKPGVDAADPEQYRQAIYRGLAESDDPLLREIGEQLRNGSVRPHQLLAIPAYAEVLRQGLENLQHVDLKAIREALVDARESGKTEPDTDE